MNSLDESLQYVRRWPNNDNHGHHQELFADCNITKGRVVGRTDVTLEWRVPCEIGSYKYDEPLECVHARRHAFGGSSIRFDKPVPADIPERCLVSDRSYQAVYRCRSIRLRWLLDNVFEVPQFCVGLAISERFRVEYECFEDGTSLQMLKAAMQIKPKPYDIVGVYTDDFNLQGAVEFAEHVGDDIYLGHVIAATAEGRQLCPGDRLFGRDSRLIGQTKITAERCLFEVLEVGEQPIPPLNTDRD
ncbi:hypothetical protein NA78x_005579 [Anatilimnocola sp. NA78]|uniref:hypothetical protein n=1 Tax=Anatilimnocola sp. NA78 TaxID=3415683 RepID=UPI003CE58720